MNFEESEEQLENLIEAWQLNEADLNQTDIDAIKIILKENQELKQKLNWIAFGDDPELALRYLRKIGYVDFDEERKVYINKHNNEPFVLDEEEEKAYYIKSEELNEYTEQLEYQNQELKKQVEDIKQELTDERDENYKLSELWCDSRGKVRDLETQQKEFIKYLEDKKISPVKSVLNSIGDKNQDYNTFKNKLDNYEEILQKYKEIIGEKYV